MHGKRGRAEIWGVNERLSVGQGMAGSPRVKRWRGGEHERIDLWGRGSRALWLACHKFQEGRTEMTEEKQRPTIQTFLELKTSDQKSSPNTGCNYWKGHSGISMIKRKLFQLSGWQGSVSRRPNGGGTTNPRWTGLVPVWAAFGGKELSAPGLSVLSLTL